MKTFFVRVKKLTNYLNNLIQIKMVSKIDFFNYEGYVSHQDLYKKFKHMNFLNDQEIGMIIKYVDPENRGYTNFGEFHSKLRAGMNLSDAQGF